MCFCIVGLRSGLDSERCGDRGGLGGKGRVSRRRSRSKGGDIRDAEAVVRVAGETGIDPAALSAALREASDSQVAEYVADGPDTITDLLVASGLSASKGAARRTIAEGGVSVNNVKIATDDWVPQPSDFLHGKWLVLRRGKRNIAGVERVG